MAENISLQRSSCIIFGLTDIVALFANEARFFRFRVFFRTCSLQNEVGDIFFYISHLTNSSTLSSKSLRKKSMLENFRANVLKPLHYQVDPPNLCKNEIYYQNSLRSWRDFARECFCCSSEAVRGLVKSRVEFPPAQIRWVF